METTLETFDGHAGEITGPTTSLPPIELKDFKITAWRSNQKTGIFEGSSNHADFNGPTLAVGFDIKGVLPHGDDTRLFLNVNASKVEFTAANPTENWGYVRALYTEGPADDGAIVDSVTVFGPKRKYTLTAKDPNKPINTISIFTLIPVWIDDIEITSY